MAKKTIDAEIFDFISSGGNRYIKDIQKEFAFLKKTKLNSVLSTLCDDNRIVKNVSSEGVFYTTERKSGQAKLSIKDILCEAMKDGEFKSVIDLTVFCGVSRSIVRNALNDMVEEQIIETMPKGVGSEILYKMVHVSGESVKYKGADGIVRLTDRKTSSSGLNPYADYRSFRPGGAPC